MTILDLHVCTNSGSTTGAACATIPAGDGQSAAGVPIAPNATLVDWGAMTTVADTLKSLQLLSQDQIDPINGETLTLGASSKLGIMNQYTNLPYKTGKRTITIAQNTGANPMAGYFIDVYPAGASMMLKRAVANRIVINQTMGALTAITWGTTAFAPTTPPPVGSYAILGAWTEAWTNYGLLRFAHADFGAYQPGFPNAAYVDVAAADAKPIIDKIFLDQGYQFVSLSETLGVPCCPVFRVTSTGTGLTIAGFAITADTPIVILNLAKVA
jgi:hypothetical protein